MTTQAPVQAGSKVFEGIVQQTSEAIVFADRDGVIRVWSKGAEALFGFDAAEAIGANLDILIPERFRKAHWDGFQKAIDDGRTQHEGQIRTTRATHKDGRKLYVDMSFGIVTGADGEVLGSMAMARDASPWRSKEAELRAQIESLERDAGAVRQGGEGSSAT